MTVQNQNESERLIMNADDIRRALTRISHEIVERNHGVDNVALAGIYSRGVPLSKRIAAYLENIEKITVPAGSLDIGMYRDDFGSHPASLPTLLPTNMPFDVSDKHIVLVDDVLYTGRTVRAAITALLDIGRPASVQLAVLLDRGHRELPIRPDYVGKNVPTSRRERINVKLIEIDNEDIVTLSSQQQGENRV